MAESYQHLCQNFAQQPRTWLGYLSSTINKEYQQEGLAIHTVRKGKYFSGDSEIHTPWIRKYFFRVVSRTNSCTVQKYVISGKGKVQQLPCVGVTDMVLHKLYRNTHISGIKVFFVFHSQSLLLQHLRMKVTVFISKCLPEQTYKLWGKRWDIFRC